METFKIGNTTVHVIRPDITEEERDRRYQAVAQTLGNILNCKVRVVKIKEDGTSERQPREGDE